VKVETGFNWFRVGPLAGFCEHANRLFSSIKGGEFLDQLRDYLLFIKDSAPWS
jgi:hypothetical protein